MNGCSSRSGRLPAGRARASGFLARVVVGGLTVVVTAWWGLPALAQPHGWSGPERVNLDRGGLRATDPGLHVEPSGHAHAVWVETDLPAGGDDLRYARRPVGAPAWPAGRRVSAVDGVTKRAPAVTVDTLGRVHVVWLEARGGTTRVVHAMWAPTGGAWSVPRRVSLGADRAYRASPAVASDRAGNVHVLWVDSGAGGPDILHRRRDVRGGWSPPVLVNTTPRGDQHDVAVTDTPSGELVAVWQDSRDGGSHVYAARLPQFGDVWWPDARLSADGFLHRAPAIASDAVGRVTAVWIAESGSTSSLRSAELHAHDEDRPFWEPDRRRHQAERGEILEAAVGGGAGRTMGVVWAEGRPDGSRLFAAVLPVGDEPLSPERVDVTRAVSDSRAPRLAADASSRAHALWHGRSMDGGHDIYGAHVALPRPAYTAFTGQGWLQYVPREPNCGTDGFALVSCDGSAGPFLRAAGPTFLSLQGSYVTVRGSLVDEGRCPHVEATEVVLEASPCPRDTGAVGGVITAGGGPVELAEVTVAGQTVRSGPSGRFFLDRVPAGRHAITAVLACALPARLEALTVPRGFLATVPPAELVLGEVVVDGVIDLRDLVRVAAAQKSPPPHAPPCVDVDRDGAVSLSDVAIVAAHYGRTAPTSWRAEATGPVRAAGMRHVPGSVRLSGARAVRAWSVELARRDAHRADRAAPDGIGAPFDPLAMPDGAWVIDNRFDGNSGRAVLTAVLPAPAPALWGQPSLGRLAPGWRLNGPWQAVSAVLLDGAGRPAAGAVSVVAGGDGSGDAWLPLLWRPPGRDDGRRP